MLFTTKLMFIILISPAIALIADYFLRKQQINARWTIFLIVLLITPSVLLELTDYSFSLRFYSFIATTLFLIGIQLGLFTILHVRLSVKVVASVVFTFVLAFIVFAGSFISEWGGGSRTIIQEANLGNYKALTLEPALYSSHKVLRVKKTVLSGILQKNIYEQDLPDSVTKGNCNINFSDGNKKLVFDFCENRLSSGD